MENTREGQPEDTFAPQERTGASPKGEADTPPVAYAGPDQSELSARAQQSGERDDVVADATQETSADNVAQTVEEGDLADQPDAQPEASEAQADMRSAATPPGSSRPRAEIRPESDPDQETEDTTPDSSDTAEMAGETADVVLDSTQEQGADNSAQTAVEQALDIDASQENSDTPA